MLNSVNVSLISYYYYPSEGRCFPWIIISLYSSEDAYKCKNCFLCFLIFSASNLASFFLSVFKPTSKLERETNWPDYKLLAWVSSDWFMGIRENSLMGGSTCSGNCMLIMVTEECQTSISVAFASNQLKFWNFNLRLVESMDVKLMDMEGQVYSLF